MTDRKINLTICWKYQCEECKHVNYVNGPELTEEEIFEAQVDSEEGEMVCYPSSVICERCLTYYTVDSLFEDDEERPDTP